MGDDLQIEWRSFALEQVNSKEGDGWKAWEQGSDYVSRGLWALRGTSLHGSKASPSTSRT